MKFNKKTKYLLVGFSIIGALTIIAGSTAAVTIHSNSPSKISGSDSNSSNSKNTNTTNDEPNKNGTGSKSKNSTSKSGSTGTKKANPGSTQTNPKNTQPEPSPTSTNSNSDKTIASKLDSLLNSSINVANYDSMNTLTPTQALNEQTNLTNAIRQAILNQISQSPFEVDGNSYNPFQIVGEINVKLPNANSLNSNYSAQIQGVSLSYNGISLNASNGSSTFTIVGFKQSSYETYIENSILNWLDSGQNVLNTSNSSFIDLIQQNLLMSNGSNTWEEYYISNNYTSFSDFKVSFTQLPEKDAEALGSHANDYWLTISAISNEIINFTSLNTSSSSNSQTTTYSVSGGTTFTWVLPYALNTISLNNNKTELQLLVNSSYSNFTNNENLPVPFGLSINITSQTNEWLSNKTIAFDFASTNNHYELPTTWAVQFNKYADAVNLIDYDLINNVANFAGTNKSVYSFTSWLINTYMWAWVGMSPSYFGNWYINWSSNTFNGYNLLEIHFICYAAICWSANLEFSGTKTYVTPSDVCYTLFLPFNKKSVFVGSNNKLYINALPTTAMDQIDFPIYCGSSISDLTTYDSIFINDGWANMTKNFTDDGKIQSLRNFEFLPSISWNDKLSNQN